MSEVNCMTCKHQKKLVLDDPCNKCFKYSCWEDPDPVSAEECIKEWSKEVFGNGTVKEG